MERVQRLVVRREMVERIWEGLERVVVRRESGSGKGREGSGKWGEGRGERGSGKGGEGLCNNVISHM